MSEDKSCYGQAGVSLERAEKTDQLLKDVLGSQIGAFSGEANINLKQFKRPLLTAVVDHRKITYPKEAKAVGAETAQHCRKALEQSGAQPIAFLDYIGSGKISPEIVADCVSGMNSEFPVTGGETAEMPGVIKPSIHMVFAFAIGISEEASGSALREHGYRFPIDLAGYENPVLRFSVDGAGTKPVIARLAGRHYSIGQDMAGHSINDVMVSGAEPLALILAVAYRQLDEEVLEQIGKGAKSYNWGFFSATSGYPLPFSLENGEYDLVGLIAAVAEKDNLLDGRGIQPGDLLIGFPSNGLHTNGYSLARKIFFTDLGWGINQVIREATNVPVGLTLEFPPKWTIGDELLKPHRGYKCEIRMLIQHGAKAIAHITGGGVNNIPRVFPDKKLRAEIQRDSWKWPPIFKLIQQAGSVPDEEMFKVFNNGIGLVAVVPPEKMPEITNAFGLITIIGRVVSCQEGEKQVVVV